MDTDKNINNSKREAGPAEPKSKTEQQKKEEQKMETVSQVQTKPEAAQLRTAKAITQGKAIREKRKHWVDVRSYPDACERLNALLVKCNNKEFGRPIMSGDIVAVLLEKITDKDIERIKELSLRPTDKLRMAHVEYNKKNNTNLSYDEFLCKQLKI